MMLQGNVMDNRVYIMRSCLQINYWVVFRDVFFSS